MSLSANVPRKVHDALDVCMARWEAPALKFECAVGEIASCINDENFTMLAYGYCGVGAGCHDAAVPGVTRGALSSGVWRYCLSALPGLESIGPEGPPTKRNSRSLHGLRLCLVRQRLPIEAAPTNSRAAMVCACGAPGCRRRGRGGAPQAHTMVVCWCGRCWQKGSRLKPLLRTAGNEDKDTNFRLSGQQPRTGLAGECATVVL